MNWAFDLLDLREQYIFKKLTELGYSILLASSTALSLYLVNFPLDEVDTAQGLVSWAAVLIAGFGRIVWALFSNWVGPFVTGLLSGGSASGGGSSSTL